MPERLAQLARNCLHLLGGLRRWRYRYHRWATWPCRLSGHLVLGRHVRLQVPLRCDGEGIVHVADRTRLGSSLAARYGNGAVMLQARSRAAVIRIGKHCAFSNNVSIIAVESVEIGDECLIGDCVSIMDSDFHHIDPDQRRKGPAPTSPVRVEDNVWLGSRVVVQKGVTIGANSVVTPNAVVTASIPPDSIAGGVPARVIRPLSKHSNDAARAAAGPPERQPEGQEHGGICDPAAE
jgi:acetyltransferase-like isoleucine patch superfamily enzyme